MKQLARLFGAIVALALGNTAIAQQAAAPTFDPAPGPRVNSPWITITTETSGATIRYTVDGSLPTPTTGTVYSGPFQLTGAVNTVRAIAVRSDLQPSTVTTGVYPVLNNGGASVRLPTDRARVQVVSVPDPLGTSGLTGISLAGAPMKLLRTDAGTPLRGASPWVYKPIQNGQQVLFPSAISRAWVQEMRAARLNSMRLVYWDAYEVAAGYGHPGWSAVDYGNPAQVEAILGILERWIDLASENGLYVCINFHNKYMSPTNEAYCTQFWSTVARYFRDRTHVLFELTNEPNGTNFDSIDYPDAAERMRQVRILRAIRNAAPDSFVLIFSPAGFNGDTYSDGGLRPNQITRNFAQAYLNTYGTPIDWSKTGVGFHVYYDPHGNWNQVRALLREFPGFWTELGLGPSVRDAINASGQTWLGELEQATPLNGQRSQIQNAETLQTGWWQWTTDNESRFNVVWPFVQQDAVNHSYWWAADPPSAARPAEWPGVTVPGLRYELHYGSWSALPNMDSLTPSSVGTAAVVDLAPALPATSNYALRFEGFVSVPETGVYTFGTNSDDGSRLSIGTTLVVDNDGLHAPQTRRGTIALEAGLHPIRIDYFQAGGGQALSATWAGPGIAETTIPATALFRASASSAVTHYAHAFTSGQGAWWSYAGDGGVSGALSLQPAGPAGAHVLDFTVNVAAPPATYWYGGTGVSPSGPFPVDPSQLGETFLTLDLHTSASVSDGLRIIIKDSGSGTLTRTLRAPGATWTTVSLPLSAFTNNAFNFASPSWQILVEFSNTPSWGLAGARSLRLGRVELARRTPVGDPPVITSPAQAAAVRGIPFSYAITAARNPTSFSASGLPAGLVIDGTTGLISGTPTEHGNFSVTLQAANAAGAATATLALQVYHSIDPLYAHDFASGRGAWWAYAGDAGVTSSLSVPPLGPEGRQVLEHAVTVQAPPATYWYGGAGVDIDAPFGATSGQFSNTYVSIELASGSTVAEGLRLAIKDSANGTLTRVVNAPGSSWSRITAPLSEFTASGFNPATPTWQFLVQFANPSAWGLSGVHTARIGTVEIVRLNPFPAPTITSPTSATAIRDSAFSYTITATENPSAFSATGLPAGLSLNTATGVISGTPTATGTSTITLGATNATGTGTATLTLTVNRPAPTITSPTSATAIRDSAFSYTITATENPSAFSATGLPAGLSLNTATGVISGTPTATGTSTITLGATNATGTGTATLTLTVNRPAPTITSPTSATAIRDSAFSYTITATENPSAFSATGLPAGLSLNTATGVISGTPTATGTSTITLGATNATGTGTATLTLTVNRPAPTITSPTSATAIRDSAFSYTITATENPSAFSATGLPAGLSLNTATGVISGTPTATGTSTITLGATNATGTGTATLTLTVNRPAPTITSPTSATAIRDSAFSYTITATENPSAFSATGLPAGLSLNTATGVISGTPTATGTSTITLGATNATGTGTATLTLTVNRPAPTITSPTSATAIRDSAFSYTITATENPSAFSATGLPAGLSLNTATGVISGTPTATGTSTITLGATNATGTGTATLTLTVNRPAPTITSPTSATAIRDSAFSYTITATENPSAFSATGLPAGLSLNTATGVISGTPTATGTSTITLGATNATGTGTATLTLQVIPPLPVITSPSTATALRSLPMTYTITATGNPTSFDAIGLPAGLTVNRSTGVISGIPTAAGSFVVELRATNGSGTRIAPLTLTITPTTVTTAYSTGFDAGLSNWWKYSGDGGVTTSLTTGTFGPSSSSAIQLSITVSAPPATYWYAGMGVSVAGPIPASPAALHQTMLSLDVSTSRPVTNGLQVLIKDGAGGSLSRTLSAPGTTWATHHLTLDTFSNNGFNFSTAAWEILIIPANTSGWGLGGSRWIRCDNVRLIRATP